MAVELRPATAVVVLAAVLAAGSFGSVLVADASSGPEATDGAVSTIPLEESDSELWLYTSRGRSFDEATLALNVVVYGEPGDVRQRLLEAGDGNWNETATDERDVAPDESARAVDATSTEWTLADGADRYAYLSGVARSAWVGEAYQIHDGTYLGSRHHIRAYTAHGSGDDGDGEAWTAMQAHHEHWDWFMGRHIVTSVGESQSVVEREFAGESGVADIARTPVGGTDETPFERWLTVVDARSAATQSGAAAFLVALFDLARPRDGVTGAVREHVPDRDVRALALAAGMVGVLAFVRHAGVALERSVAVPPKAFAFVLYPVLFVGLPVVAYLLSRQLDRSRAFTGAAVGFLAAVLVDYSTLGVTQVPLDVLVHRGALAVALGMIAVGGSRVERRDDDRPSHVRFGVLLWLVATVLPLLRHTPLPV